MTLTMAWVRTVAGQDELIFASDSRLSGGSDWDCCPKLMMLPRGDCALAFAGSTLDAYPLMLQFRNWIETNPPALRRAMDINDLKKRVRLVFNDMRRFISDLPNGQMLPDPADCELIFGGWSWKRLQFRIWRFFWYEARSEFDFEPIGHSNNIGRDHPITFAGTHDAVDAARQHIVALLKDRERFRLGSPYFDMEPFEALRDVIRSGNYGDVGGAPQLIKIYRHGNTQPFAIPWNTGQGTDLTVLGRPLFRGEKTRLPVLDPDDINFIPQKTLLRRMREKIAAQEGQPS